MTITPEMLEEQRKFILDMACASVHADVYFDDLWTNYMIDIEDVYQLIDAMDAINRDMSHRGHARAYEDAEATTIYTTDILEYIAEHGDAVLQGYEGGCIDSLEDALRIAVIDHKALAEMGEQEKISFWILKAIERLKMQTV